MSGQTEILWGAEVAGKSLVTDDATNDWTDCTLGEVINLKRGYDLPNANRIPGTVPIISSSGVTDYHANSMVKGPGVVTGRYGTIGKVFYTTVDYWPLNTALYVQDFKGNDKKFIYYFLSALDFNQFSDKSAVPGINRNHVHEAAVSIPPLPEQRAIASVLSSLDDKIDLLHRQNATLEALAETLFRQWFVEEAKEEWEEGMLGDLFTLQRGFDLPIQNRVPGKFPIITSSGYSAGHNEYKIKGPGVTTGRSGVIGKVFYVIEDFWPLNTSLFIKEYKLGTPLFSYFTLKFADLESFNAGSAVPTLNRNHVHAHVALLPPKELMDKFEDIVYPHFEKMFKNTKQIQTLSTLRDTLLPKLMSGEVRVAY